jgi:hypothetical protein
MVESSFQLVGFLTVMTNLTLPHINAATSGLDETRTPITGENRRIDCKKGSKRELSRSNFLLDLPPIPLEISAMPFFDGSGTGDSRNLSYSAGGRT